MRGKAGRRWWQEVFACRRFEGAPDAFWPRFLEALVGLAGGERGLVLGDAAQDGTWKPFCRWPRVAGAFQLPLALDGPDFERLVGAAMEDGVASLFRVAGGDLSVLLVSLETAEKSPPALALLVVSAATHGELAEVADEVLPARDVPAVYQRGFGAETALADADRLEGVLDILAETNRHPRFVEAAMAVVNETASHFSCSRASLGWCKGGYVRLKAVSNLARFDPKMDAVQQIEDCMEEAVDQECEVFAPATAEASFLSRHHDAFRAGHGDPFVATVPFRDNGSTVGALTVERADTPFSETDLTALRVLADQGGPRLVTLHHDDRWWGAKLSAWARDKLARFLGPERTWAKLVGILCSVALLVLIFWRVEYRVEASFILRSDDLTYLTTPFDGYIEEVAVRVGDAVPEGALLVRLDTSDLVLSEASSIAQVQRYRSEAENAESERRLADMRVSTAMEDQELARLELVRHRIAMADIRAPFDGVIVLGDLRDKIGKAVKKGDLLMQMTRLDNLYAEMKIPERDIQDALGHDTGEVAFASLPETKFAFTIERIEPAAVPDDDGNVFLSRAHFAGPPEEWWRPGMTGVAKINTGPRSLLWIFTHRLVDFLRMKLWW